MQTTTQAAPSTTHSTLAKTRQPRIAAPLVHENEAPLLDTQLESGSRLGHSLAAISVYPPHPPIQPKSDTGLVGRRFSLNSPSQIKANSMPQLPASWTVRPPIQAKLTVGQPNDEYEQEADRIADQVMRMAEPRVQAKCACGGEAGPDGECAACRAKRLEAQSSVQTKAEDEEGVVQTKSATDPVDATPDLESRLNSSHGSGSTLSDETRTPMESAFGVDFSGVRVHTGNDAVQMNRELSAQAFTHGSDIYFNAGKYEPGSVAGKGLLAHELTHVVQQNDSQLQRVRSQATAQVPQVTPSLDPVAEKMKAGNKTPDEGLSASVVNGDRLARRGLVQEKGISRRPHGQGLEAFSFSNVSAPGTAVIRRTIVNPVRSARHNKIALLGDGTPANRGLIISDLEAYTARQADWFTEPTLTVADRDTVWKVLLLLARGAHFGMALGSLRVAEVAALSAGDMTILESYIRGFDSSAQTVQLSSPVPTMARALQLGRAIIDLAAFVPAPVLRVVIPESGLIYLVDNTLIAELRNYYTSFTPTLEVRDEWPHVQTLLGERVATYSALIGWVHDLHIFTLASRRQLVRNVADTSRARPVLLILFSGTDWNAAFMQAANLEAAILDAHNLALVIQGPTSIAAATAEVNRVANNYGQQTTSFDWNTFRFVTSPGRLGQVVIAGHGSDQTVEMATSGTGATAQRDNTLVSYNEQPIDSSNPVASGTQALIDAVLHRLDPAAANIVFAGCLVGSHEIPASTNVSNPATAAANLRSAVASNPNLADYVRQRMTALGITGQVQAANASTTFGAFNLDAAGHARLSLPWDPGISGTKLQYVQTGMEPEGALRAALEIYADPLIGPTLTTTHMRTRVAGLTGNTDWWATITRLGYQLALPAAGDVDVSKLLDLSHRIDAWFLGGWANTINVQWMADNVTAAEAPTVFPAMLTTTTAAQDHLSVGAREAWLKHDPAQAGPLMTALTASSLTRTTLMPLLARTIIDPHLAALLPVGGAPTKGQLLLALTIAHNDGASMPADVRSFLRAAAGGSTTSTFPAGLGVGALLDGASEIQILRNIGLAPASAPVAGVAPPTTVDANVDANRNNTNESYVPVDPHEATVNANNLRVRSRPSTLSGRIMDHVNTGNVVRVMGVTGNWSFVDHAGRIGFIYTRYLTR